MADPVYTGTQTGLANPAQDPGYDGSTPGSGKFGLFQSTADAALKNAITRVSNQRGSLLQQSGFVGQYDDKGAYTGFQVAGDSPFGTYQGLMRGFADTGEQSDAAQAGLGFKGGLAQQLGDRTQMGVQQSSLGYFDQFNKGISDLGDQEAQAQIDHDQQLYNEKYNEVQLGVANGDFNQAVIPPGTGNTYNGDPNWNPTPTPGGGHHGGGGGQTTGPRQIHRQAGETRAQYAARLYNYRHRKGGR